MWMPYLELLVLQLFVACTTCQPFIVPVEICPGDSPNFTCIVEDVGGIGSTLWLVTVNGTDYFGCIQTHAVIVDQQCGPNSEFHSFIVFEDSGNYTSTLTTVRSISPSFNGTGVQCAAPRRENVIGSSEICITGGSIVPPHVSSAVISEVGVSGSECVVTVSWSEPVISCNDSTSQYVLTVSPNTIECSSGSCEVGRGEERFEKRELNITLTVEQMYNFTVRADTCNNNQTGQDSEQFTIQMEATSESCEYIFSYNGSSFDIDTISISWRLVNLGVHVSSRIQYTLVINPGGQRVPVSIDNCYSTHCSYMYTPDGSETDYSVSVEAVGCVTGTTACRNMSSSCSQTNAQKLQKAWKAYENSCVCGYTYENNCAHFLSNALIKGGFTDLNGGIGANFRNVNGRIVCRSGRPVRAKELRAWARATWGPPHSKPQKGINFVYQERSSDGQGHVLLKKFCHHKTEYKGTGNFPSWKIQEYYY